MEAIFEAVLANDPSRIAAIEAGTPGAAKLRMDEDLLVTELPHMLYRGDTPLHLAAAGLRYDAARALRCCPTTPTPTVRPVRQARPRCTSRSHRPAQAEPPEPATTSSR